MIDKILFRSKAWELFVASFALVFLDYVQSLAGNIALVYDIAWFIWIGLLGYRLQPHLMKDDPSRYRRFRISIIVCPLVFITVQFLLPHFPYNNVPLIVVYVILAITQSVSLFFILAFVARAIKVLDTGGDVVFGDYFGTMMAIMFFPIGIWFLQPTLTLIGFRFFPD